MLQQTEIISSKIKSLDQVLKLMKVWRLKNQKVVFTNGVFDILHPGHISYLAKTKDLGNKLILGFELRCICQIVEKGPNRPIQNQNDRAFLLAALSMIDAVVIFNEETPL